MEAEVRVRWPQVKEFRFLEGRKDKNMDFLSYSSIRKHLYPHFDFS